MVIARLKIKRHLRRFFARHRFLWRVETVLFWLLCAAAVYFLVGFFAVPMVAKAKLSQFCGGAVDIESGSFKGLSAVRLKGVVIAEDSEKLLKAPILQADKIEIQFEPWQILKGRFNIHSIQLKDVLLTADYEPAVKKWNVRNLSFKKSRLPERAPISLITIERGALRVRMIGPDGSEVLTTVSINGSITEQAVKNEYAFLFQTDGRFGYGKSSLEGGLRIKENGVENHLWATGEIQMPAVGVLSNRWDLRDIKLDCTYDESKINVQELSCFMGDGRAAFDGAIHWEGAHPFEVNIDLENLTLSDQFVSNTVIYRRLHEFSESGLTRFLNEYHPAGRGDMKLAIKGTLKDLKTASLNGVIHCRDISICDDKFPYRLDNLRGDIEFEEHDLRLNNLQARHGDVQLLIDGTVWNLDSGVSIDIRTTSPNMRFDEDLKKALSESIQKVWFEFSPTGRTGVDYHFKRSPEGEKDVNLVLNLDGTRAVYKYFPYPMDNLTGTIIIQSQRLEFKDILAHYEDSRRVRVDGEVSDLNGSDPTFHVTIQAEKIPVDRYLIEAMPENQQPLFDRIETQAVADFTIDVFPNQIDKRYLDYRAEMEIDAKTFLHEGFPLPMSDVVFRATVTPDVVKVRHFEAQTPGGQVNVNNGDLFPQGTDPNRPGFCLNLNLENFELNEMFWKAAGPDANQLLGNLRAFGAVDVNGLLEVNLPPALCKGNNLSIHCKQNPLLWGGVGIGTVAGWLKLQNDSVSFSSVHLNHIPLELLPPDLMSPKIREIYTGFGPKGSADIAIDEGLLEMGPEGYLGMYANAKVDLENVSLQEAKAIRQLDGACQGQLSVDFQDGSWGTQAYYDIRQLQYDKWLVTGLNGNLTYDPNVMQLKSDDLKATFYCADNPCRDDQVTGKLIVSLASQTQPGYELELNYQDVDLRRLMAVTRSITQEQSVEGLADGSLVLIGKFDDLSQPRGKFAARILNMKMGQQSLLGKVLTAVQLKRPEDFVFNEIELNADVRGPELIFDRVRIVGTPLGFNGKGTVDLQSRQIAMELASWDRMVRGEDNVFDMLFRGIGSALWKVEIHGDLDAPNVDAVYLSVLKQPLDVFKNKNDSAPAE